MPASYAGIKQRCCLTSVSLSDVFLSRTSGLSREQKGLGPIWHTGTVAHVTRDSDTTFKVKRSKVNLQGRGNIVADSRTSLIFINSLTFMAPTATGSKARSQSIYTLTCIDRLWARWAPQASKGWAAAGPQRLAYIERGHIVSPRAQLVIMPRP